MRRSLIIGGGIALFAGSAVLATLLADSAQHEPYAVLPTPVDSAGVQIVPGTPLGSPDASGAIGPITVEELRASAGGGAPGAEYLPLADPSASPTASAQSIDIDMSLAPEVGSYSIRFRDLCAVAPVAAGCPLGIGGTILPLGDPVYPPFELLAISDTFTEEWGCEAFTGSGQHLIGIAANHPARIEIRYWPADAPAEVRTTVVDNSEPDSRTLIRFLEMYASPTPPLSSVVSHCAFLDIELGGAYVVEAHATSFTGEVDDLTVRLDVPLRRPPVILIPRGNYQLRVGVPVSSEPRLVSKVRLLEDSSGESCFDLTTDTLLRDELATPPATGRFERRDETYGDRMIRSPYDLSYDNLDLWTFDLKEGSYYFMCVWWLRSPDDSTAPGEVVEVEQRLIATPNMQRTVVSAFFMFADADGPAIEPDSYHVWADGPCESPRSFAIPTIRIEEGTATWGGDPTELCVHTGVEGPSTTRIHVELPSGEVKNFFIPTPNTRFDYQEGLSLYLGDDPACANVFDSGSCFGPRLHVLVSHSNESIGARDWELGIPEGVQPPA